MRQLFPLIKTHGKNKHTPIFSIWKLFGPSNYFPPHSPREISTTRAASFELFHGSFPIFFRNNLETLHCTTKISYNKQQYICLSTCSDLERLPLRVKPWKIQKDSKWYFLPTFQRNNYLTFFYYLNTVVDCQLENDISKLKYLPHFRFLFKYCIWKADPFAELTKLIHEKINYRRNLLFGLFFS